MANRIVVPGGSGFLGQSFVQSVLRRDNGAPAYDEIVILTRSPGPGTGRVREVAWDGKTLGPWADWIDGAAAVVNFAGKSVNCRYTPANRRAIVDSRVDSVTVLEEAIRRASVPPPVFVQAGSLAIYGNTRDRCDESAPHGSGFSVRVCEQWEEVFFGLDLPQTRQVMLRIGFALGKEGGALEPLARLARFFLGGTIGSGEQYISWIHLDDLNEMIRWAVEREDMAGIYNATGPAPVTNATFMRELRRALNRPWSPPTPGFAVRIGSRFMGTEPELALHGRRCVPARFEALGFPFAFSDLSSALRDLFD